VRRLLIALVGFTIIAAPGCNRLKSKRAVQAAIEEHLKQRPGLMMDNMTTELEAVTFSGQTAEARVKFRSKQLPQSFVEVRYTLRQADGRWEVESSSPLGPMGSAHRGAAAPGPPQPAPSN